MARRVHVGWFAEDPMIDGNNGIGREHNACAGTQHRSAFAYCVAERQLARG